MAKKKERILWITLVKSPIGYSRRQRGTLRALGLRRMHQTVEHKDTPVIRGMIAAVSHLVRVEEE
ncbi:MAG TPA: 50S ribosomal protein L30 [Anaerolineae bacterium]|nr:50S ribosomal protein L30 [Anaerolineae bacterium]HID84689.1 50S ribosomal protein L30 [Anaerolineales bacterium]HIQ09450.1 50S ribosomal protein L30 [Anaerolineaceae bacterium]